MMNDHFMAYYKVGANCQGVSAFALTPNVTLLDAPSGVAS